eukprot:6208498-Pleurochrysis_carterae.AAC.2
MHAPDERHRALRRIAVVNERLQLAATLSAWRPGNTQLTIPGAANEYTILKGTRIHQSSPCVQIGDIGSNLLALNDFELRLSGPACHLHEFLRPQPHHMHPLSPSQPPISVRHMVDAPRQAAGLSARSSEPQRPFPARHLRRGLAARAPLRR